MSEIRSTAAGSAGIGELPKLLTRDFAVGFVSPSAVASGAIWTVLHAFGYENAITVDALTSTTIVLAGAVLLISITLLALNPTIFAVLKGDQGWAFPAHRERSWKKRFRREAEPYLQLQRNIDNSLKRKSPLPPRPVDFRERLYAAVDNYPDEERWVKPTSFGNIFRAFEVYSRKVYGMDMFVLWWRLLGVLPEQFRTQLSDAQAQLNFFINLMIGGGSTVLLYLSLTIWERRLPSLWLAVGALALVWLSYRFALIRLRDYGEYVKSAFDLYRGELAKQLGLEIPRSATDEREMWQSLSVMMIYRSDHYADQLTRFRAKQLSDTTED